MSKPFLFVFESLSHNICEVSYYAHKNCKKRQGFIFIVYSQYENTIYKKLHVILHIPTPWHTHSLPIIDKIIYI
jgi:hypothetical protein